MIVKQANFITSCPKVTHLAKRYIIWPTNASTYCNKYHATINACRSHVWSHIYFCMGKCTRGEVIHFGKKKEDIVNRYTCNTALFPQEVYDWVGGEESVPVHFTLHRVGDVQAIRHGDIIKSNKTISLAERVCLLSLYFNKIQYKSNTNKCKTKTM